MVTRLKKFSRRWYCKFIAYLLILALSAGFVAAALTMMSRVGDPAAFESKSYADSTTCSSEFERVVSNLVVMLYDYGSEANVRKGGAADEQTVYATLYASDAYQRYQENWREQNPSLDPQDPDALPSVDAYNLEIVKAHPDWSVFDDRLFVKYLAENPQLAQVERANVIAEQLRNYARVRSYLGSLDGQFAFYAYRKDTNTTLQNAKTEEIQQMPLYQKYDFVENAMIQYRDGASKGWYSVHASGSSANMPGAGDELLVGIRPSYLAQREQAWMNDHRTTTICVAIMVFSLILALILFVYLCLVSGRLPDETSVRLYLLDRMYSELHVAILIGLTCGAAALTDMLSMGTSNPLNLLPVMIGGTCGILALAIPTVLSLVRSLKAHRFFRSFAVGRLCIRLLQWCAHTGRAVWEGGSLMLRGMLLAIAVPLLCLPWVTVPFIIALLLFAVYRTVSRFQRLQAGVRAVRSGDLGTTIDVKGGDLGALAEDINTLREGLDAAISAEVKSERLKTELISNVSHDIKTPLTSIVTYVDLLKNELAKPQPDDAALREYADIIERKTARLRVLTTDLFEAAKATSGAMTVELEQVDFQALVRQGLGEFDDKLHEAQLEVRMSTPEKPVCVTADGRLVWRIFENMMSNVIKYAMPGSRVYLDLTTGHGMAMLTMKNISAYELNIPAEELMERFKRGDESRSSEGSGLGLSIAISLAQLQHGLFSIEIDGDLFKATLSMPLWRPAEHEPPAQK